MSHVTNDKMDLSHEVAQRVQIEDVRVARAAMTRAPELHGPMKVEVSFAVKYELLPVDKKLIVIVSFKFQGKEGREGAPWAVGIETTYLAIYRMNSVESLTHEHLQAFAEMNGVYNTWPFWREFIQSATTRMGLPVFTLPVLPPITKQPSGKPRR